MKRRADTGKWEVRWRESGRNRSKSFTLKSDARRFEADVHRACELGRPLDMDRGAETLAAFVGRLLKAVRGASSGGEDANGLPGRLGQACSAPDRWVPTRGM